MPCKTLRIGVFFDGTGNTKQLDKPKGKESNIAKLSELYKKEESKDKNKLITKSEAFYINGVGTYDTQDEHDNYLIQRKYDKGSGGGGAWRINKMIEKVTEFLDKDENHYGENLFKKREIDVFGFSRGAAMARDFVNTFINDKVNKKDYKDVRFNFIGIYDTVGSFGKAGNSVDMKPKHPVFVDESYIEHPIIDFFTQKNYGLTDIGKGEKYIKLIKYFKNDKKATEYATKKGFKKEEYKIKKASRLDDNKEYYDVYVLYVSEKALFEDYNFALCSKSANKIVHMTAHDEVRKNFPLTNIEGSGGDEYTFIGVHSDIGGGYSKEKIEKHELKIFDGPYPAKVKNITDFLKIVKGVGRDELEKFRRNGRLQSLFWDAKVEAETSDYMSHTLVRSVKIELKADRKINNRLANVTLHLMHEEAIKNNVPFKDLPDDDNHNIPDYLENYYNYAKKNKASASEYLDEKDGKLIKRDYVHHSAVDPLKIDTCYVGDTTLRDKLINDSADGEGNDTRYINSEGKQIDGRVLIKENPNAELMDNQGNSKYKVKRAIYDNKPNKAVIPKENKDKGKDKDNK